MWNNLFWTCRPSWACPRQPAGRDHPRWRWPGSERTNGWHPCREASNSQEDILGGWGRSWRQVWAGDGSPGGGGKGDKERGGKKQGWGCIKQSPWVAVWLFYEPSSSHCYFADADENNGKETKEERNKERKEKKTKKKDKVKESEEPPKANKASKQERKSNSHSSDHIKT